MIATSRGMKLAALGVAIAAHGLLAAGMMPDVTVRTEGAGGAAEVRLGTSFADMAAGTQRPTTTETMAERPDTPPPLDSARPDPAARAAETADTTEPGPTPEPAPTAPRADAAQKPPPTDRAAAARPAEPARTADTPDTAEPGPAPEPAPTAPRADAAQKPPATDQALAARPAEPARTARPVDALPLAPAAPAPVAAQPDRSPPRPDAPPDRAEPPSPAQRQIAQAPQPAPAASPEALDRLEAVDDRQTSVTRSLRPPTRPATVEARARAETPPPRPDRAEPPRRAEQPPVQRRGQTGNAQQNARAGQAQGTREAQAVSRGAGRSGTETGNAATRNYPGDVMQRLSRVPRPSVRARGEAVVAFRIGPGGALAGLSIARSSGSQALDRAAMAMVQRAAPFPAPPSGAQRSFSIRIAGR